MTKGTITTGMHPALAASLADHIVDCEDVGGLSVSMFFATNRTWNEPDSSVGFHGGWEVTAKMIGAQIGSFVLSRDAAIWAFGRLVPWTEREVSERLTEGADYDDAPRRPSRMEGGE